MQIIDNELGRSFVFENPKAMMEHATAHRSEASDEKLFRDRDYSTQWFGHRGLNRRCKTWEDLARAYDNPWQEGLEAFRRMQEKLEINLSQPVTQRRRRVINDDGPEVLVDRIMRGERDWAEDTKRVASPAKKTVSVLIQNGAPWFTNAMDWLWSAACAVVIVDHLETAGFSVEVWTEGLSHLDDIWGPHEADDAHRCKGYFLWKLKEAGQPVDVDQLLKGSSAWFGRTVRFGNQLDCPPWARIKPSGLSTRGTTINKQAGSFRNTVQDMGYFAGSEVYVMPCPLSLEESLEEARKLIDLIEEGQR